jgi:hypothetical protein
MAKCFRRWTDRGASTLLFSILFAGSACVRGQERLTTPVLDAAERPNPLAQELDRPTTWFENPREESTSPHPDAPPEKVLDNLSVFLGLAGSKQPQDAGINANFGGRLAINEGLPLLKNWGVGLQIGTAVDYSAGAVHVLDQIDGTTDRWQSFTTVGLFQRTSGGFNWGVVYDFQYERYFDRFDLGQWRGQVGYAFNDSNEVGLRGALRDHGDSGTLAKQTVHLEPITQGTIYWRHTWATLVDTSFWVGMAERHHRVVFVFPDNSSSHDVFVFGADLRVPLNDHFALFGSANFLTPNDTGTVDAYLGIEFYPGGGVRAACRHRFAPLLPVAGNPEFSVDLSR